MQTARLFQNGQSQAVRLPKEFRFTGDRVLIRKMGNGVLLLPYQDGWESFFQALEMFPVDFMADGRLQPADQPSRAAFDDPFDDPSV